MSMSKRTNEEWRALLAEQRASGQSQEKWCAANGINLYTLRDRSWRLKRLDNEATSPAAQHGATTAGWIEVKPQNLVEDEQPATEEELYTPASSVLLPEQGHNVSETASENEFADIRIMCGKWIIAVSAGSDVRLLADVLQVVNQVCC
jgi:hypothetical protein